MAGAKYSRVDGRKSKSYCSTPVLAVFFGLCLVGVWMLMSSPDGPAQNISSFSLHNKSDLIEKLVGSFSRQFEDSSGEQAELGTNEESNSDANEDTVIESLKEEIVQESSEENRKNDENSKKEAEDEGNGESKRDSESNEQPDSEDSMSETKSNPDEDGGKPDTEEIVEAPKKKTEKKANDEFPKTEVLKEATTKSETWATQVQESEIENSQKPMLSKDLSQYKWKLCNVTAGPDYIPCLDNLKAISKLHDRSHYQHRERHCPEEAPTCLVSLPEGYRQSIKWPKSREQIWYYNVPHTKLAEVKGHQNWVKVTGDHLTFPGGGTQFIHGALHYIDFIEKSLPKIAWGKRTRVILDVGCGVASLGGYLFERDVLAMSFAPKDEHEAQVQFALERGIPAISAVMGTKRLPFPSKVFDVVHCARCRVPWHIEGGKLLLELNRVLRPGGYFVWSATPVYRNDPEDVGIWKAMAKLTKSMCWDLVKVKNDKLNGVGAAIFRKPTSNDCYENRPQNDPPLCNKADDPDAVWNVELQACIHKVPDKAVQRGAKWPEKWPQRLEKTPYWLGTTKLGVYGKAAPEDFTNDYEHWKHVVSTSYLNGLGIDWSSVRNAMDMKAVYGGFAAALKELKLWVMNVVPITSPDTLPIIYERGLFGIYHDWCESFSTYPRTYDLVHADHLFSDLKKRCKLEAMVAEVDRILRPKGTLIVRDNVETMGEIETVAKSLHWKIQLTYSKDSEGLLCVQKTTWRPTEVEKISSAIA